jgi:hypothetical protein
MTLLLVRLYIEFSKRGFVAVISHSAEKIPEKTIPYRILRMTCSEEEKEKK